MIVITVAEMSSSFPLRSAFFLVAASKKGKESSKRERLDERVTITGTYSFFGRNSSEINCLRNNGYPFTR